MRLHQLERGPYWKVALGLAVLDHGCRCPGPPPHTASVAYAGGELRSQAQALGEGTKRRTTVPVRVDLAMASTSSTLFTPSSPDGRVRRRR
jgi:hypothetical protein